MLKPKDKKKSIGLSINESLLKYVEKQAKKHKVNRSMYINHLVEQDKLSQGTNNA